MSSVVLMHHHKKALKLIDLNIIIMMAGLLKLLTGSMWMDLRGSKISLIDFWGIKI